MALKPENEIEDFRLDRAQLSVVHLTDPDDSADYWLSRPSRRDCGPSSCYEGPSMAIPALARDFKEFLKSLNSNRVEYLLIGGYAVGIYGHIRATNDLDIWIRISPENGARVHHALREFGFDSATLTVDLFLARNNVVRMGVPPSGLKYSLQSPESSLNRVTPKRKCSASMG